MDTTEERTDWKAHKNNLKKKFAAITNSDSLFDEGIEHDIRGKLQINLGKTKEEIDDIFKFI